MRRFPLQIPDLPGVARCSYSALSQGGSFAAALQGSALTAEFGFFYCGFVAPGSSILTALCN
jgi:hypothetical protein